MNAAAPALGVYPLYKRRHRYFFVYQQSPCSVKSSQITKVAALVLLLTSGPQSCILCSIALPS